jgi:uncharacterized membrane protein YadS
MVAVLTVAVPSPNQPPGGRPASVTLVAINSLGWVPPGLQHQLSDLSRNCLVLAIAALGLKTSFQQLAQAGWRPFALLVVETLWMAAFVLIAIEFEMR